MKSRVEEIYGINVDKSQISNITDKIIPVIKEWQTRPLDQYISDNIFRWNIS